VFGVDLMVDTPHENVYLVKGDTVLRKKGSRILLTLSFNENEVNRDDD
jgi:hypothetical protein